MTANDDILTHRERLVLSVLPDSRARGIPEGIVMRRCSLRGIPDSAAWPILSALIHRDLVETRTVYNHGWRCYYRRAAKTGHDDKIT